MDCVLHCPLHPIGESPHQLSHRHHLHHYRQDYTHHLRDRYAR